MASSFGRLALGVVGAIIGAPFGLSAVGFSIGSAIGGFLFAPEVDGPDVEGPRIGDTDVTTSTLGKTISEHFGVTRAAGNVFWSAGLKEVKTVTSTGGGGGKGGGGGGGGTQTTYDYFGNFASGFGRGPAAALLKLWADGKLIYDVGGSGDIQNDKYKFRFRTGESDQGLDNLIAESINRRLQGLPDVNEGNGPQSSFRTINDLIAEATAAATDGDARSQLYVNYLTQIRDNAIPGIPNDYSLTPAYRDMCYIVFEDMPLADFGNRLPNITAEIAWGDYAEAEGSTDPRELPVTQTSTEVTAPETGVGVDSGREVLIVRSGSTLRKFSAESGSETLNKSSTAGGFQSSMATRILGPAADGSAIARATPFSGADHLVKISSTTLTMSGQTVRIGGRDGNLETTVTTNGGAEITYGASLGSRGQTSLFGGVRPDGYYYAFSTGTNAIIRQYGGPAFSSGAGDNRTNSAAGIQLIGDGPIVNGGSGTGFLTNPGGVNYVLASNSTHWQLVRMNVNFGTRGRDSNFFLDVQRTDITPETSLNGESVANVVYDAAGDRVYVLLRTGTASGRILKYNPDGTLIYTKDLTLAPPSPASGLQRSSITTGKLAYAQDNDVAEIDLNTGEETVYEDILSGAASDNVQVYIGSRDTLFTWIGDNPVKIEFGRTDASVFQSESTLRGVIETICSRTGMESDEYDVTDVSETSIVRGYTVSRPSSGRAALEKLLTSYFVDGVESDYAVRFRDRTTDSVRTLTEDELGVVKGPTGEVNFLEARRPEYELPAEINIAFVDQFRDYQQGAANFRRISQPVSSMYSNKTQNLELPIVFSEAEAAGIAQRLLFLTWLSRDTAKSKLNWSHLDLDPGDVVEIAFNDGRTLTDRIGKHVVGANFEIDLETSRSGDPVYAVSNLNPIGSSSVPSNGIVTPVFTELFVLDMPLLEDFHDTGRTALRYYTVVGADTSSWLSATLYTSLDNSQFTSFDTQTIDITWGQCQNALGDPRNVWATDKENSLNIQLSVDNGDVASVTFEDIVNSKANRALIWNPNTGFGELIQFQTVVNNIDGTITISNLSRGLRGTDYAAFNHDEGEYFLFLPDSGYLTQINPLDQLGSTQYFKAVSSGALLSSTISNQVVWEGRDLKPYAPNRVNREISGGEVIITWNRRTRVGGEWNMIGTGVEFVPLNEDNESYEFYLIDKDETEIFDPDDAGTYSFMTTTTDPTYTITAAELLAAGYMLNDTLNVAVAQVSAQVGRGFVAEGTLAA